MWAIKVLNGSQAGKIYQIPLGKHSMGRSHQADIRLQSNSVSKIHAQILVTEDKLIISDQKSSNGVFVNGIKVQNKVIQSGDKFSLSDMIFDVIELPNYVSIIPKVQSTQGPQSIGSSALATVPQGPHEIEEFGFGDNQALAKAPDGNSQNVLKSQMGIQERVENYVDEVALPGVYQFSNKFDLKYVILTFVIVFIVMVTILSVYPVLQVSRDFVVNESQRRAESLTRLLVQTNRQHIVENNEVNVSINSVIREPGVEKAFIIDAQDGHIIAPINKRGRFSKITFLQRARKKSGPYQKVMDNQIGVSIPILHHNPMTGEPAPKAYAIVLYNMDKSALDIPRVLSLMIQILIITMLAGALLYFFLYKVITKPIYDLNKEMDIALKEGNHNIELSTPTPIFQKMVANINSALSRIGSDNNNDPSVSVGDKGMEAMELVQMFPVAALAISTEDDRFLAGNELLNGHPLFDESDLTDKYLDDLTDPSLIESMKDLLQKAIDNPNQKHNNTIPTQDGEKFDITIKSIQDSGTTAYYVVCFTEIYDDEDIE